MLIVIQLSGAHGVDACRGEVHERASLSNRPLAVGLAPCKQASQRACVFGIRLRQLSLHLSMPELVAFARSRIQAGCLAACL